MSGIRPLMLIVPLTLISAATILAMALSALQAMTEEEFTDGAGTPRRGAHAGHPWSLRGGVADGDAPGARQPAVAPARCRAGRPRRRPRRPAVPDQAGGSPPRDARVRYI